MGEASEEVEVGEDETLKAGEHAKSKYGGIQSHLQMTSDIPNLLGISYERASSRAKSKHSDHEDEKTNQRQLAACLDWLQASEEELTALHQAWKGIPAGEK